MTADEIDTQHLRAAGQYPIPRPIAEMLWIAAAEIDRLRAALTASIDPEWRSDLRETMVVFGRCEKCGDADPEYVDAVIGTIIAYARALASQRANLAALANDAQQMGTYDGLG